MSFLEEWNMKRKYNYTVSSYYFFLLRFFLTDILFRDVAVDWMPSAIANLKSWIQDLDSASTYAERSWRDLSKGRWEAKTHGLGKDAVMRPPSGKEETLAPVLKLAKDNKIKRASTSEDPKPKTRTARKPKKNTILLTEESVRRLRDEDKEEEGNEGSILVARVMKTIYAPKAVGLMAVDEAPSRTEGISEKGLRKVPESLEIKEASHRSQQTVGIPEGVSPEVLRTEELGVIVIEDSPTLPAFSEGAIRLPALALHQDEFSKSRTELSRREIDFQRLSEEKNALRLLNGQKEEEIKDLRAELAKTHQDQTDLTEQVAELAKCQSQRETLEEIHARGFDLTEVIKKAKELEADAGALAFDDDDDDESKSGSESGEELDRKETAPGDNQEP
ncbi:uncharacterized protein [Nicotiana tomentosiformis]|uniref:uncharacterized protein n=1 Tax=Nicotiana tomentosiformis TaxID=4098 RepID=UPI00388CECED